MKILVINGPNLNLLGLREPHIYGSATLADVEKLSQKTCEHYGYELDFRQSNHEGEIVTWLQEAGRAIADKQMKGVVLNAGAYTHTSVAIHDAIKGASVPTIELHISNIHAREEWRHQSYISLVARGIIMGLGINGYALAISALAGL
jgi:3-dehydroquinate dehydratase II